MANFNIAIVVIGDDYRNTSGNGEFLDMAYFAVPMNLDVNKAVNFLKETYYADVANASTLKFRIARLHECADVRAQLSEYLKEDSWEPSSNRLYGYEYIYDRDEDGYISDYPSGRQPWVKNA